MGRPVRTQTTEVPAATGVRVEWWAVPAAVRGEVERRLGSTVVSADTQPGGFSPGAAARVRLADGRRVFIKAVGAEPNSAAPDLHRNEARIAGALPASAPVPRLLLSVDTEGWVALVFEDVDGRTPAQPWRPDELDRVLSATAELAALLDPAPVAATPIEERLGPRLQGWRRLAADPRAGDLPRPDAWTRRNLHRLAEREAAWTEVAAGSALLHGDLRADNVLLTADRVVIVDWPWATVGAPWIDVVAMGPSVIMQGGPETIGRLDRHLADRGAEPAAVTTMVVALTGFFLAQSAQPDPPGLPTLRPFQRAQGLAGLRWVRARTGWH